MTPAEQFRRAQHSLETQQRIEQIAAAEKIISEMNEEEIAAEWAKIEEGLTPEARAMFAKYGPDKRRTSGMFKAHVADMIQ